MRCLLALALLALALLALAWPARAQEGLSAGLGDLPKFPYENQGKFVTEPARAIAALPYQIGFLAGAFVCLPGSLLQDRKLEDPIPRDQEISVVCGKKSGLVLGWPVYAAVGLPLFLLKDMFWTGPRAIGRAFRREPPPPPKIGNSERPGPDK